MPRGEGPSGAWSQGTGECTLVGSGTDADARLHYVPPTRCVECNRKVLDHGVGGGGMGMALPPHKALVGHAPTPASHAHEARDDGMRMCSGGGGGHGGVAGPGPCMRPPPAPPPPRVLKDSGAGSATNKCP